MATVELSSTLPATASLTALLSLSSSVVAMPTASLGGSLSLTANLSKHVELVHEFEGQSSIAAVLSSVPVSPKELASDLSGSGSMSADLSTKVVLTANLASAVSLVANLDSGSDELSASLKGRASLSGALGFEINLAADTGYRSSLDASLGLSSKLKPLELSSTLSLDANLNLGREGLSFCNLVDEVMWLWGISSPCHADDHIKQKAVNEINKALQFMWSQADQVDYWSRSTITVSLGTGVSNVTLPDNVQNIVGHARIASSKKPLPPLQTRGELDNYAMYYLGNTTNNLENGVPEAYYAERLNQSGLDAVKINFHVVPAPIVSTDILLDVVMEAPRYAWRDYGKCSKVPVPHRYIESLLLPIVLYQAKSFYLFHRTERADAIDQGYVTALMQLGVNDPLAAREEVDDDNG